jgi:hypothetical protein
MVAAEFSTLMTMETEEAQIAQGLRRRESGRARRSQKGAQGWAHLAA